MLFGVKAFNAEESRFFAISATNETDAIAHLHEVLGSGFDFEIDALENIVQSQYGHLAELGTHC